MHALDDDRSIMMDELIQTVQRTAQLSPEQAEAAVSALLRFFTARLPSALVGELHARLQLPCAPLQDTPPSDPPKAT